MRLGDRGRHGSGSGRIVDRLVDRLPIDAAEYTGETIDGERPWQVMVGLHACSRGEADDPFALWPEFLEQRPDPAKVTLIRNKADLTGEDIRLEVSADGHVTISLSARSTDAGDGLE